jgi:glycosyltransferase involved in cell wall biosynthesis
LRIVLLTSNEIGGVLTYVLNFSKYLKNNKINCLVILSEESSRLIDSVHEEGNIVTLSYSKWSSKRSKFSHLKKYIFDNDILVVNDTTEMEFINHYQLKNKSIYILHGDINHYQGYLKKYHEGFDEVFCVSMYLHEKYKLLYPNHSFSIAHPMVEDYSAKENFSVSSPVKIASIGRFEYLKGSDTINNTICFLNKNKLSFSWTLFIPPVKNDIEALNKIQSNIIVKKGYNNNQVLDSVEQMDILFFPSRSEGFSMSIIECLKRGVIIIARDIPMGIPEVIQDKINGFICKDEIDFQLALQRIIEDPNEILQMKYNAYKSANELFGYDKECEILYNLINSTGVKNNKKYVKVEFSDPMLPEYLIRSFRFFKYNLLKIIWN